MQLREEETGETQDLSHSCRACPTRLSRLLVCSLPLSPRGTLHLPAAHALCISLPDHSQELLHHQPGLRSQNLYPEKAEVILGPAESAMGTSSIYTAHVQHPHHSSDTGPRAGANGCSDLPKHTSKPMLSLRGTCCALPSAHVTGHGGWRRPRGKAGS